MSAGDDAALLDTLLAAAHAAQAGLLQAAAALGWVDTVAGQPAWPFARRLALETLMLDPGLARQLVAATVACGGVLLLGLAGVLRRRGRWVCWMAGAALALWWPWPPASLWLAPAVPTSFHRSPTRFDAASVSRGLALYQHHCLSCHGADGRGEGPAAASLPVWPPTLSAGLLWKRPEGELLWRILHGMRDRAGRPTMPGFGDRLGEDAAWALLDGMRALSAGDAARRAADWPWPVRAPDFEVSCAGEAPRRLDTWRGQRLRIVAGGSAALPQPLEDPRLVTVVLRPDASAPPPECVAIAPGAASQAYATLAGTAPASLAGLQFIVDRDGWLRALARPPSAGWSEDDLVCRTGRDATAPTATAPQLDGLGALIARMDADPVRSAGLGLPHRR